MNLKGIISNMKIGRRLALTFALVLSLVTAAAGVTLIGVHTAQTSVEATLKYFKIIRAMEIIGGGARENMALVASALLSTEPDAADKVAAVLNANRQKNQEALAVLDDLVKSEEGKMRLAALKAKRAAFIEKRGQVLDLLRKDTRDQALAAYHGDLTAAINEYRATLVEFENIQIDHAEQKGVVAVSNTHQAEIVLLVGVGIALLLAALISVLITRSITIPLRKATAAANAIANGDFDLEIDTTSRDEAGLLLHSMKSMQDSLRRFMGAQFEIGEQHDTGAVDYRIDAAQFPGAYGQMAQCINDLVASHLAVQMRIVEVVKHYADGDFSIDMDRLPGRKALITEAIDGVKLSFESMSSEIMTLVDAAARGDFTARGHAERYRHNFHTMVEGLNHLMSIADSGLSEVGRVLGAMAQGDLMQSIDGEYAGTFGKLKDDTNRTVAQLRQIVDQIRTATGNVNAAAGEMAAGNANLSARTEQQAASLEEAASSMEQMSSTVKRNAEGARHASEKASGASSLAARGGQIVSSAVNEMERINDSSKKIVEIIGVIDGIAFQTNILALNAAVEAARAGDHGRGFGVVASEVRSLAQRSATAAKEIKQLISDSVEKVGTGTAHVHNAGKTMEEIVRSVKEVADILNDITSASREQSSGIDQVAKVVGDMDEMTQQNAALVEQATAASKSMEDQAQGLSRLVAAFRISSGNDSDPAVVPAATNVKPMRAKARSATTVKTEKQVATKPAPSTDFALPAELEKQQWAAF